MEAESGVLTGAVPLHRPEGFMEIDRLGIVGCGLMGSGIAEVAGRAGLDVLVVEVDEGAIRAGRERVEQSLNRGVAGGKLSAAEKDVALKRITFGTDLEGLAHFPFVIEAIVEDLEAKNDLFGDLDQVCDEQAIFATNTSSLTVTDMAARTRRPERFVGVHFFNPVPVMKLVEVVRTVVTSREVLASVVELVRRLGKEPIAAKDNSGFVVNLLLVPYILDAIGHLERGVARVEDIDKAMVLGCGHPMGPLELADLVGLDTLLSIAAIMYEEYREKRYAAPPLLRRLVTVGRYGRKAGRGFYDWTGETPVPLPLD